jgi:hypothetical protein
LPTDHQCVFPLHLHAMNVLIYGADPFDGKMVIGQRAALADQVHTERQIGKSAAGKICLRGLYRQKKQAFLEDRL